MRVGSRSREKGDMMSGVEWTIVTVVGVCLILLFVLLEIFFPLPDTSDQVADGNGPDLHAAGSHTLQ